MQVLPQSLLLEVEDQEMAAVDGPMTEDELEFWLRDTLDLRAVASETLDLCAVDNETLATRMVDDARPEPDEADLLLAELKAERKDGSSPAVEHQPGCHTVSLGDTLRLIAFERLGDSRRWYEIWKLNYASIRDPLVLLPGTVLRLPEVTSSRAA